MILLISVSLQPYVLVYDAYFLCLVLFLFIMCIHDEANAQRSTEM